ncbi:MAG: class I SAM-dependent methyltransferase [Candidatus Aenigmarchaeota archaeon]|nr:class I SAM-dependent methyltransferase [Candidatus Aenigmarchaeota archaeon]
MSGWGKLWGGIGSVDIKKPTYMWSFYQQLLGGYDFSGARVLEIGCGTGINTIMMGLRGADITFLDQSEKALSLVRGNVKKFGLKAEYINEDAFECNIKGEYDLVHSEGLIEHFRGERRQGIVDVHAGAARRKGSVAIVVPHAGCAPYVIGKYVAQKAGTWVYGEEYPYTRKELEARMGLAGLKPGPVIGGELVFSPMWLFSPLWLASKKAVRKGITLEAREGISRANHGNFLANRIGRIIGAVGIKI